ncbi:MAG: hypothetical protein KC547_02615 [Anaerolineae bacterium]|nr:hypothetical protein [Anaerolineae bacterium]MCA9910257.1 hypothetical protein [Anaerolineae bacterium]
MEIIQHVTERTGISEQQAQQAIDGLNSSFKSNLPAPLADAIGGLLTGGAPASHSGGSAPNAGGVDMNDALGMLGGLLGGAQGSGSQGSGLDDLLGGLLGGSGASPSGNAPQGSGLDDLLGGLLGNAGAQPGGNTGGQSGLGLDDLLGMLGGGGNQGGLNLDGLVTDITNNSGVSPDIATTIIQIVLQFLGERLPEPLGSLLSGLVGGQSSAPGNDDGFGLDDIARGLGGILGGQ